MNFRLGLGAWVRECFLIGKVLVQIEMSTPGSKCKKYTHAQHWVRAVDFQRSTTSWLNQGEAPNLYVFDHRRGMVCYGKAQVRARDLSVATRGLNEYSGYWLQ